MTWILPGREEHAFLEADRDIVAELAAISHPFS